ncbi:archaellin/type IV pilin N-terminal domain-containing protein [Natrialbaceae archaeon GCM10025810]|uniref:archaellin/type IV pilin N-terminal domain-containing protein n=1 Tax=Halovalidus salilacus TaxID=3075124 RepID=UPI0036138A49
MINTTKSTTERGQVGIGTLIVFIAMVLVAAIAAGVLINTAGFLQTQAEATGEESTEQVSDNVQVVNSIGLTNSSDDISNASYFEGDTTPDEDEVAHIELTVQKSAGSGDIDLSKSTIEYSHDEATTLTYNNSVSDDPEVNGSENSFATEEIRGEGSETLTGDDDRVAIHIPLGEVTDEHTYADADTDQPAFIEEGEQVDLTISTPQGSQTSVSLEAPEIIDEDEPAVQL